MALHKTSSNEEFPQDYPALHVPGKSHLLKVSREMSAPLDLPGNIFVSATL
jgi:hypothetical protein